MRLPVLIVLLSLCPAASSALAQKTQLPGYTAISALIFLTSIVAAVNFVGIARLVGFWSPAEADLGAGQPHRELSRDHRQFEGDTTGNPLPRRRRSPSPTRAPSTSRARRAR